MSHLQISDLEVAEMEEPLIMPSYRQMRFYLFNSLPDNYRFTFNLYEIEGYSHEEIGRMLDIAHQPQDLICRGQKMLRIFIEKISTLKEVAMEEFDNIV